MSIEELAEAAGVSPTAIAKAEATDMHSDPELSDRLRIFLESKGVIFLAAGEGDPAAGPGVRLRLETHDEGIRPQNLNAANDG
jgi:transcriptional regulator with XRE-family HTH domain